MNRARRVALLVAAVALAGMVASAIRMPAALFPAWLAVGAAWLGWPLGSMALLLVHALTGGRWGEILHPALRTGIATLPVGLPALGGVMLGARYLYPWLHPDGTVVLTNGFYLNAPAALARAALYGVAWGVLGLICLRGRDLGRVAPAGLIVLGFTSGFAAIDLTESLDPHFSSSAYGLVASAGAVLLAFAVGIVLAGMQASTAELRDLVRLLLGLTVLWAYLDFMQFLIVWQSNLPVEAAWYGPRLRGGWGMVALCLVGLHFIAPFVLLAIPSLQVRRPVVVAVAALLVGMEVVRNFWLVLPGRTSAHMVLPVLLSLAFFGSASVLAAFRPGMQVPFAPCRDARRDAHV
ncbi:hypothetical protein K6L44_15465 [Gluconacetobacter entanii]|uniref:hypothetical protein n=1 Tax=Gluconacetobacter entanii TaxID=108528 RepID=UPI001C935447|nr:hypothetical protein [Gluconacetobacter entanii]MBY4641357.1 hypothetical protein [Gluconacetobacter entanii]MCW4581355.1 hypothetical protein [Gluconacetobacter entanii]MCW4584805.1 hypothetical protein [Gluconacetobacter entanii]MCW4588219.1 hypothetical protein [Gluconacetobacter entanii]